MKSIETLVEDVYGLFTSKNRPVLNEDFLNELTGNIRNAVVDSLTRDRRNEKKTLRLSLIGFPDRKIWYELQPGNPNKEFTGETLIKFLYGSILESLLVFLVRQSGHSLESFQKEVTLNGVVGHNDAVVDGVLVDFKSASNHGFRKFKEGTIVKDDPFGYVAQLSAYAEANGLNKAGFVAIDKSTGEIVYCPVHEMDRINAEKRINDIKKFIEKDSPPPRCYPAVPDGNSGNLRLGVGCSFCDYKHDCWKDSNNGRGIRTFDYSGGQKYLVQVVNEPRVPEVL